MLNQTLAYSTSRLAPEHDPYRTRALNENALTSNQSRRTLTGCDYCGAQGRLILAEQSATLCQVSRRRIYVWIEAGALHFQELPDGAVLVCSRSLLDRVELHEGATSRLPALPTA
jgi:hypothetical protein